MDTDHPALGAPQAAPAGGTSGEPAANAWLELLLAPRSIRRLLFVGGGLAIAGLLASLVSLGVFDDPRVVAAALGIGTAALLAAGWFVSLRTRYRLAGHALTFLGCIVAPLNLWFSDWQGLVTVDGHLWVGGVVCCLAYVATVCVLKDPVFLYAVEAGVTLTVLLVLGDVQRSSDSSWVCVALVTLGIASVLAERTFAADHAVFDRRRFGRPLFVAGQVQLAAAAAGVLGLQTLAAVGGRLPVFGWDLARSTLATTSALPAGLWLALAGAWLYSDVVVLRGGRLAAPAAVALLLAAATLFHDALDARQMMLVGAAAGFACVLAGRRLRAGSGDLAATIGPAWATAGELILTVAACAAVMDRGFEALLPIRGLPTLGGLVVSLATAAVTAAGGLATRSASARRWHLVAAGTIVLATVGGWIRLLHLAPHQKLELTATLAGLMLFAAGCGGRVRERDGGRDDGVTALLWTGSMAAIVPALWVVLRSRWFGSGPSRFDEMLLVTAVLPTLVLGCLLEVRSATLVAGAGLALYLLTVFANLVYRPDLAVGIYLGVGGAVIFVVGILLSMWRDRLLAIPRQIAEREGVFRVMRWR